MENNTYLKFGFVLLFICIYAFASLTVYLDKHKMKKTKNTDIEKEISNVSSNQSNKINVRPQQPTFYSRKNAKIKNEVVSGN